MCTRIGAVASALAVAGCLATPAGKEADHRATSLGTRAAMQAAFTGNVGGRWYTGDGGESAELPDGREITVMGDTFSGPVNSDGSRGRCRWFARNAAIIVGHGTIKAYTGTATGGYSESGFVPMGAQHVAGRHDYYWPEQVFMDGGYLRLFVAHVYSSKGGRFNVIGTDLATFAVPRDADPRLLNVVRTPASQAGNHAPVWGAAVIQHGRYTYVFGAWNKHEHDVFGFYYYLARVPRGKVADLTAWRYWTGSSWAERQTSAVAVIPGAAGIGSTATVIPSRNGGFAFIGKKNDVFGSPPDAYLAAWRASSLTGPFVESKKLLELNDIQHNEKTYLGLGHPEVSLPPGKLLVSWCVLKGPLSVGLYTQSSRYGLKYATVDWP